MPNADKEPAVGSVLKTHRLILVFDRAINKSHMKEYIARNRVIDPARLPSGTWAVRFHDRQHVVVNGQKISGPLQNQSPLTLIAQELFPGYHFAAHMNEVSVALKHDCIRPVIQLPASAYNYNSEDLSGQYKVVPRGAHVINTQGERLWPLMNEIS